MSIKKGRLTAINYLKVGKDVVIQAPQQGHIPDAAHLADQSEVLKETMTQSAPDLLVEKEVATDDEVPMMVFGSLAEPFLPSTSDAA